MGKIADPLVVVQKTREEILAGHWITGRMNDGNGNHCLVGWWQELGFEKAQEELFELTREITCYGDCEFDTLSPIKVNDRKGYEAVIALLDDLVDALLGAWS